MQEAQVVGDLLFPAYEKSSCAIEPRVSAFYFPASGLAAVARLGRFIHLARDMGHVASRTNLAIDRLAGIPFIETKILRGLRGELRTLDRDAIQSFGDQFLIRHIGAFDCDGQGNATAIDQRRPLHAQFASVGRVFAGFFPRPAATWSSPRPCSATSSRYLSTRHIPSTRTPTTPGTRPTPPTPESTRELRCPNQTAWASPSIDNRWLTRTRCRPLRCAAATAASLLWDLADTWEGTGQCVPKDHRECRETSMRLRRTQAPPCKSRLLSSTCTTNACTPTVRYSDRL
jgi:hypothetical protein